MTLNPKISAKIKEVLEYKTKGSKMAGWNMMLDANRVPPYGYITVHTVMKAKQECLRRGVPDYLILEYYLGENEKTGLDFVEWLIALDQDMGGNFIPRHFDFYVHTQNKEGAEAINTRLRTYLEQRMEKFIDENGNIERRDRRSKPLARNFVERRSPQPSDVNQPRLLWGNLTGSDYAFHTRNNLISDRRKLTK